MINEHNEPRYTYLLFRSECDEMVKGGCCSRSKRKYLSFQPSASRRRDATLKRLSSDCSRTKSGSQEDIPSTLGVLSETPQWMIPRPSCLRILSRSRPRHAIVPRGCAHHPPSYQPFQARGSQGFCKSSGPRGAQTAAVFDPDDHASGRARNGISRSAEYPRMQTDALSG
jgi:hypothetical protein